MPTNERVWNMKNSVLLGVYKHKHNVKQMITIVWGIKLNIVKMKNKIYQTVGTVSIEQS